MIIRGFLCTLATLLAMVMMIYKMLQVYAFTFVAGLNDDIWSFYALMASVLISLEYIVIRAMLGDLEQPIFDMLTCVSRFEVDQKTNWYV